MQENPAVEIKGKCWNVISTCADQLQAAARCTDKQAQKVIVLAGLKKSTVCRGSNSTSVNEKPPPAVDFPIGL